MKDLVRSLENPSLLMMKMMVLEMLPLVPSMRRKKRKKKRRRKSKFVTFVHGKINENNMVIRSEILLFLLFIIIIDSVTRES